MDDSLRLVIPDEAPTFSPTVRLILDHLCQGRCHTYGDILEWCESRGDCSHAVECPTCAARFVIDDDELDDLRRWTDREGHALVCGVRWN